MKTYIETHLKTRFIRLFKSPAAASILFNKKLDSSFWLFVNYQGLNNLTIKNRYLLPLIGKALDWLDRAKQFIQLNLITTYHQMRIREGDEWKTAFRTWHGHFKYQVMLFELSNASASFYSYINKILSKKLDVFIIVYLNNILIYTKNEAQGYVKAVQWVLDLLRKNELFANSKKCWFHQDKVRFLGYAVSAQGV